MEQHGGICPEQKIPHLATANQEAWTLFSLALPGLTREDGYDYGALQVVLDLHGIEQPRRPALLAQFVDLIGVVDKARRNT